MTKNTPLPLLFIFTIFITLSLFFISRSLGWEHNWSVGHASGMLTLLGFLAVKKIFEAR